MIIQSPVYKITYIIQCTIRSICLQLACKDIIAVAGGRYQSNWVTMVISANVSYITDSNLYFQG